MNNTKGKYLSLALDLQDQHQYQLSNPGQFRFTPPTHLIAAAYEGLHEWETEGINGRFIRLKENRSKLINGLAYLGFDFYVDPTKLGYSCVSIYAPKHEN